MKLSTYTQERLKTYIVSNFISWKGYIKLYLQYSLSVIIIQSLHTPKINKKRVVRYLPF